MKNLHRNLTLTAILVTLLFLGACKTVEPRQAVLEDPAVEAALSDEERLARTRQAAEEGDAEAQYRLGEMYKEGKTVAQDDAEAVKWFRRAADQGHARGQVGLGLMYENGRGVEKNEGEAVKWYRRAADQGDAGGQTNLGTMYANGKGVARNAAEAVKWYRRAADQGNARGQSNLGTMYVNGKGVVRNDAEAVKWFRLAAHQGYARGQAFLGWMYLHGRGVDKNETEAAKWLRASAKQGDDWAREQTSTFFNYDALDEDVQVTYEEHLAAHSLELYAFGDRPAVSSGNGKRMAVYLKKKGTGRDFVGAGVWEYAASRNTFVKHPFRFLRKSKSPFAIALSRDGKFIAYHDKEKKAIAVVDLDKSVLVRSIPHDKDTYSVRVAISRDNETLALAEHRLSAVGSGHSNYLSTYSLKTGTRLSRTTFRGESTFVGSLAFLADGNLALHYHVSDKNHNATHTTALFDSGLQPLHTLESYSIVGISPDGDRLVLTYGDSEKNIEKTKLYNARSLQWEDVRMPFTYMITFGPRNRFADNFEEYILRSEKAFFLQRAKIARDWRKASHVVYVAEADSWFVFQEDRILPMKPAEEDLVEAMVALEEGRELLQLGFHEPGAAKIREAMAAFPAADRLNDSSFYAGLAEKTPLRYIGDLLLFQYGALLRNGSPETDQVLTNAVERLRDYGLFAAFSGHPILALQAAQRIRFLQTRYPDAAAWNQLVKNAVALEALDLAARQSPDKAYDHILGQGGLVHDGYTAVADSITAYYTRPYWAVLYADRDKLAHLLKRDTSRLSLPKAAPVSAQPYPDLTGKLIEPATAPPELRVPRQKTATQAQPPDTPSTKGRVLD